MSEKETTHFGYREVDRDAKAEMVADVFHSVAARYDLMNDLMSGGIHRIWKRFTIELSGVRKGNAVLDIAGGTGDLAARFADIVGPEGRVVLADINAAMLQEGRRRLVDAGIAGNVTIAQVNAEDRPARPAVRVHPEDSLFALAQERAAEFLRLAQAGVRSARLLNELWCPPQ